MKNLNNIFLIGPMGAGKSTIGRKLAKKLKLQFFDSDQEIEKRTGARIPLIFEIEGEQGFRTRETGVIDELTKYSDIVLATGGGAILDQANQSNLNERGLVVYLRANIKHLLRRTARDTKRPLLNTDDRKKKMEELLKVRAPIYEKVADLIIDTDQHPVPWIVEEICKHRSGL